jgi:hypothetical protein
MTRFGAGVALFRVTAALLLLIRVAIVLKHVRARSRPEVVNRVDQNLGGPRIRDGLVVLEQLEESFQTRPVTRHPSLATVQEVHHARDVEGASLKAVLQRANVVLKVLDLPMKLVFVLLESIFSAHVLQGRTLEVAGVIAGLLVHRFASSREHPFEVRLLQSELTLDLPELSVCVE